MPDSQYFEVQRLVTDGDRVGQWETVPGSPLSFADQNLAEVFRREVFKVERRPFRVVPFGTGPNARPGDVLPSGEIFVGCSSNELAGAADGVEMFASKGRILVFAEQAENAACFGWSRTGHWTDGGTVVIERASE